jgi:tRNA modification GTPase
LDSLAFGVGGGELALTVRHIQAIETAVEAVGRARECTAAELMAAELRAALDALGQVLGDVTPDDILGRVFSTFCIGK